MEGLKERKAKGEEGGRIHIRKEEMTEGRKEGREDKRKSNWFRNITA